MNSVINSEQSVYEVIREKETDISKGFTYVFIDYNYENADDDNDSYDDNNDNDKILRG